MHAMIGISLTLLVIVAGLFLLAKTRTHTLGTFFKIASYTVITAGFLCLVCCIMHYCCHMGCSGNSSCADNGQCEMHHGHGGMK
jgi:hypothetical protein